MKFNSFLYLPANGFEGIAIGRVKATVVAIGAAAGALAPIPVRTGKPGIHCHFLNSPSELFFNVFGISVKPAGGVPGIRFVVRHYSGTVPVITY
jgi:hypothetical protein